MKRVHTFKRSVVASCEVKELLYVGQCNMIRITFYTWYLSKKNAEPSPNCRTPFQELELTRTIMLIFSKWVKSRRVRFISFHHRHFHRKKNFSIALSTHTPYLDRKGTLPSVKGEWWYFFPLHAPLDSAPKYKMTKRKYKTEVEKTHPKQTCIITIINKNSFEWELKN